MLCVTLWICGIKQCISVEVLNQSDCECERVLCHSSILGTHEINWCDCNFVDY